MDLVISLVTRMNAVETLQMKIKRALYFLPVWCVFHTDSPMKIASALSHRIVGCREGMLKKWNPELKLQLYKYL